MLLAVPMFEKLSSALAESALNSGFGAIGRGIGAIMLLIVVIYYIASILDGGKFQIKMLMPLLIFFFVCNFSMISRPVQYFTNTLAVSLMSSCDNARARIAEENGNSPEATISDMNDRYISRNSPEQEKDLTGVLKENEQKAGESQESQEGAEEDGSWWVRQVGMIGNAIKQNIIAAVNQSAYNLKKEMSNEVISPAGDTSGDGQDISQRQISWTSVICSIISWVCVVMSFVNRSLGAVMSSLIIAFGPITFAFAIMPGQANTIKSWFIRLCQFSLYAPICALIDNFSYTIFGVLADCGDGTSTLMAIVVAVVNLVGLTSVPTIASMIIEGAQGAISLSQGLQTMASTLGKGMAVLKAGGSIAGAITGAAGAAIGKNNVQKGKDVLGGMASGGIGGMVKAGKTAKESGSGFKGFMAEMQRFGKYSRKNR